MGEFVLLHWRRLLSLLDGCWIYSTQPKVLQEIQKKTKMFNNTFLFVEISLNQEQWPQVFCKEISEKKNQGKFSPLTSCFHLTIPHPQRRFAWEESRSAAGRGGRRARGGLGSTDAAGRGGGARCGELQRDGVGSQTWGWCERSVMNAWMGNWEDGKTKSID